MKGRSFGTRRGNTYRQIECVKREEVLSNLEPVDAAEERETEDEGTEEDK